MNNSPINSAVMRFNTIPFALMPRQGRQPETRLQHLFTTLLSGFVEFRHTLGKRRLLSAGVDKCRPIDENGRIGFNQPISFDRLTFNGRHAALFAAIFLSASRYCCAFLRRAVAGRRLRLLVSLSQSVNPAICPPPTFDSVVVGFSPINERGIS